MRLHAATTAIAALGSMLAAQSHEDGYAVARKSLPPSAGQVLVLQHPDAVVWFDGNKLVHDDGKTRRTLLSFSTRVFGSFTIALSGGRALLFGEGSTGGIWLVPLAAPARRLATLRFNFDAVAYGATHALVSAKTGGLSARDNDVFAVDLGTGATDRIARIPGASGPLAVDRFANLYYATASASFPPPPGSTDVVRFDARKVRGAFGSGELTLRDAVAVVRGLDSGSSLALDNDDDLFVTDWKNGAVEELSDVTRGGAPRRSRLASYTGAPVSPGALQFLGGPLAPAEPRFEPFQPGRAGVLAVHESKFGQISRLAYLSPVRPRSTVAPGAPIPPGRFAITSTGAPRGGLALAGFALRAGAETPMLVPGFEPPLFLAAGLIRTPFWLAGAVDATGRHRLDLVNPGIGGRGAAFVVQVAFAARAGAVLGSAAPLRSTLQ